jgi:hypothetical protein
MSFNNQLTTEAYWPTHLNSAPRLANAPLNTNWCPKRHKCAREVAAATQPSRRKARKLRSVQVVSIGWNIVSIAWRYTRGRCSTVYSMSGIVLLCGTGRYGDQRLVKDWQRALVMTESWMRTGTEPIRARSLHIESRQRRDRFMSL